MEIVAEFTYNHSGSLERTIKMIDAAKAAGATCIKFELRDNESYFRNYPDIALQKQEYEFSDEVLAKCISYCVNTDIRWFASIHDVSSLKKILPYKPHYIKIASREARIIPFLNRVKELNVKRLPIIISTGGLSFQQIEDIYNLMQYEKLILLHTSCLYPCSIEDLNINRIIRMKQKFNCAIGYSGHEQGFLPSLYAASLGINYIERHFTLENDNKVVAKGKEYFKDELCTLGPVTFKEMTNAMRIITQLKGQVVQNETSEPELNRVNAYGIPSWNGEDVYVK